MNPFATNRGYKTMQQELINNLVNEAKALNCSNRMISNLEISGMEDDFFTLVEEVEATKVYLEKERQRKTYMNFNLIAREAASLAVKELNI
jgi:hypothetical protein